MKPHDIVGPSKVGRGMDVTASLAWAYGQPCNLEASTEETQRSFQHQDGTFVGTYKAAM